MQPAMEREWATDPFEMQAIDGYLYGRGTSDNKVRPRASVLRVRLLRAASVLSRVQPSVAYLLIASCTLSRLAASMATIQLLQHRPPLCLRLQALLASGHMSGSHPLCSCR